METLWIVLALLIATRMGGIVAAKLNQPALVGELLAGIALGIVAAQLSDKLEFLNISSDHHLMALADLGIFFLMLLGGFEMRPRDLIESSYKGLVIASSAMLLPLLCGFTTAWLALPDSELRFTLSLFVGTSLAVTAVPVTIKVFMDMHILKSRLARLVVTAAVFDDFLSLILLSILVAIINNGKFPDLAGLLVIFLQVTIFLTAVFILGSRAMQPAARYVANIEIEEINFSFLLLVCVVFAVLAELLGLHYILGAFAAGLFYGKHTTNKKTYYDLQKKLKAITNGFLAPIFFASIGIRLSFSSLTEIPLFLLLLFIAAFAGKLIGAALPARLFGFSLREACAIGVAMNARGAVGLIVAGIALDAGLFAASDASSLIAENLFSAVVFVVVLTTVLTPIGLKVLLRETDQSKYD